MARILVIDDDEGICLTLLHVARRAGHEAIYALTLAEGWELASSGEFDIVFLDVRLQDGNGLELLPKFGALSGSPEVIIITGFGDAEGAELAIRSGAWDYIEKGDSAKAFSMSLSRAIEYRAQKLAARKCAQIVSLKRDAIIGTSSSLKESLDLLAKASCTDTSVMITGETGTGKELFARAVHENSHRSTGRFVVVDCAAMPEHLIESMLFGHEKGAFTGADHAREGLVRQADNGTLFLDEVGELPQSIQKAFLRVLQEHSFRPIGSPAEVSSNFRVVAATNRDLDQMVNSGSFRQDLLFRLRGFEIHLPPLRERLEDLKDLVRTFADRSCERHGIPPKGLSTEIIQTLQALKWPGNVRQLANTVEQAVGAAGLEPVLFSMHLPTEIRVEAARSSLKSAPGHLQTTDPADSCSPIPLLSPLHEFRESIYNEAERKYLNNLMEQAGHDITEACRVSGLSQSRLYALLKKQHVTSH
ncbi:acetoacetate metabolism regulatory protein AtoC [Geobacter sp. OR-1]|uniref:sigma-54-dependent transcriptional regulator n=1 Tax=Geobacter sp. OR-1 TaxID=1266765 RepID=UPI0005423AFC|nr:sigma-54 dependent transcriptional regulator [Geobacter sp. OR-1]GAM10505.1 acetoacetate metabolism regulatory protein AtoC [Geobacter sp. OR-1]